MDIHPWTNHDIARQRCEERLLRAQAAQRAQALGDERGRRRELPPRRTLMRSWKGVVVVLAGVFLASAPVAFAHRTSWAWTEGKAERVVRNELAVQLPPVERAKLEDELRASAAYYFGLAMAAREEGDELSASAFFSLAYTFREALAKVRGGLEIERVECLGSGAASKGTRFKRFRCSAMSELLEIPTVVTISAEEGKLPKVARGKPRTAGPLEARFEVRVTGRSTIAARQIG